MRTYPYRLLLLILLASLRHSGAANSKFFVSPNGQDSWSGSFADPAATGKDGPFASIQRALDAAKALRRSQGGTFQSPCIIYIRGGVYTLDTALVIGPELSGTTASPLVLSQYRDEVPVLNGGRILTGWKASSVNGFNVWETTVPEVKQGSWSFHQLWANGQRRHRARAPNRGSFQLADSSGSDRSHIAIHPEDLAPFPNLAKGEAVVFSSWVDAHMPIKGIQGSSLLFDVNLPSQPATVKGERYYVENSLSLLDEPGEWYLDETSGRLVYFPMPGETLSNTTLIAPRMNLMLRIAGDPSKNISVENIQCIGLTFSFNEWYFPKPAQPAPITARCLDDHIGQLCPDKNAFGQASVGVPALIQADGLLNGLFQANRFIHIGTYALQLYKGCRNDKVIGNRFEDMGAGAIKMGQQEPGGYFTSIPEAEHTSFNLIQDNLIKDGGQVFQSAVGIWIGQSHDDQVVHNEISDFFYSGMNVGWAWGYSATNTHDNLVAWNHIHHIGRKSSGEGPYLSDMGAIYTLGIQAGTTLDHNLLHDVAVARYGGWGIYFDQATSHVTARNNIVYNTYEGGFFQNWGQENLVENNVFAFDAKSSVRCFWHGPELRFTFRRNIAISQGTVPDPVTQAVNNVHPWSLELNSGGVLSDSNVYWQTTPGRMEFERIAQPYAVFTGLDKWNVASGMEAHSLNADPLFTDAANSDFSLSPGSPALGLGFRPFDLQGVGARAAPENPWDVSAVRRIPSSLSGFRRLRVQGEKVEVDLDPSISMLRMELCEASGRTRLLHPIRYGSNQWKADLPLGWDGIAAIRLWLDGRESAAVLLAPR